MNATETTFGRWILTHPDTTALAWSGMRWVMVDERGVSDEAQVCNFPTREDAEEYASMIDLPDTTESNSAIAMRLMVRLGRVPNTPKFTTEAMLEIAKLFADNM